MNSGSKRVRMADLVAELPIVELRPPPGSPDGTMGREVQAYPLDGACAQLRAEYEESGDAEICWKIAARVLPDATDEEIARLSIAECQAVIEIASGKADELLAAIKSDRDRKASGQSEGNPKAPPKSKAPVRRRGTGSPS